MSPRNTNKRSRKSTVLEVQELLVWERVQTSKRHSITEAKSMLAIFKIIYIILDMQYKCKLSSSTICLFLGVWK